MLLLEIILILCFASLGGSLASFGCVVWERGKKKESINGRSECACGRQLTWYENIPIIGWLRIGGVTKCCNVKLPLHYLVTEIIGFITFGIIGYIFLNTLI